jgi:hypothetical protein
MPSGTHLTFDCPSCGSKGDLIADYKLHQDSGGHIWKYVCNHCGCGKAVLEAIGTACGEDWRQLLDGPPAWLGEPRDTAYRQQGHAPSLPSRASVNDWARALRSAKQPLHYMTRTRGITPKVLKAAKVGWDGRRLTFPMFQQGNLVALKTRLPQAGAQMMAWPGQGRPWPLYPEPDEADEWVLLVAGELDALRGRAVGLPSVSVTLGAGTWRPHWTETLRGRRIIVCFDNNERQLARRRVRYLRAAGVSARQLDLRKLGLHDPKGDLSDYLNGSGSIKRFSRVVRSFIGQGAA